MNIDSGTITGTDVNVSSSVFTTSALQNLNILQGANSADVDFGNCDIKSDTVTTNLLNTGSISAFAASGAINFNSKSMTNVNIDSGTITGTDVNVSSSTFTTNASQKLAILQGAASNVDFGAYDISANSVTTNTLTTSNAIFTTMAETLNEVSGVSSASTINIDYSSGSVVWLSPTGDGPFTYNFTNIPNATTQSHIVTVLMESNSSGTRYADTVQVGSSGRTLLWNSGSLPELDVASGDIITQQFSILPSNLSSNVLTNVSYYKTIS